ncbi:response regulator [Desulfobacterales bacterium HSG16]|nr:response regulator [Desulfobacterales bacterium HSG16]
MAAAIVHDLKNPIGIIMGYAQMAEDEEISSSIRNEYLHTIYEEAMRMSEMAHEILTFSQRDVELNLSIIHTKSFYDDIIKLLNPLFSEEGMFFKHNFRFEGYLQFDINKIRRVILNLATNAKDAMLKNVSGNGSFSFEIDSNPKGIIIKAIDNGPGIPESIRATLFEPFVTHGKTSGTGLGMAIVKKIITAHGGTIAFETHINKGTNFTISIPMDFTRIAKQKADMKKLKKNLNTKRVLIVDDNPSDRWLYRSYLKDLNCYVVEASSGNIAFKLLAEAFEQKRPFDAVIIDKNMPGMNGEEIAKTIHQNKDLAEITRIMLTEEGKRGDLKQAQKLGFAAYLTKPIEKSQLTECLELALKLNKPEQIITRFHLSDERKKKVNILIADDNVLNQKMILAYLKKFGYSGDVVSNGKEVLEALQKVNYDIILMDVTMPEMDGFEATRHIRNQDTGVFDKNIPIIAITAHTREEDIKKCLNTGMNDCVLKPIKQDLLIETIKKHTDHKYSF